MPALGKSGMCRIFVFSESICGWDPRRYRILNPPYRPSGTVSSTSRCSTRAPLGPCRNWPSNRSTASTSPSAAASTRPSGRLRTQPCSPSRRAARSAKNRKPTPCTRPLIKKRRATRISLRGRRGACRLRLQRFRLQRVELLPLKLLIDGRHSRLHDRIELRQLVVETARQGPEDRVRLFGRARVCALDHTLQRRDLVVQLDREIQRILAALQLHLVDLGFDRSERLLEIFQGFSELRRLGCVELAFAIRKLSLDAADE